MEQNNELPKTTEEPAVKSEETLQTAEAETNAVLPPPAAPEDPKPEAAETGTKEQEVKEAASAVPSAQSEAPAEISKSSEVDQAVKTEETKAATGEVPGGQGHKESEEDVEFKKVVSHMPDEVKPRFVALKYITDKRKELADKLEEEIRELERQFDLDCVPLDKKREELINGKRDPMAEELEKAGEFDMQHPEAEVPADIDIEELKKSKGVPGFWKTALRNSEALIKFITDEDAKVLDHLTDIRKENLEGKNYRLVFKFAPNEFFTNEELVKTIIVPEGETFCQETQGTEIEWKEGKNVTKKTIKKKQKNKKTKATREVTKTVDIDSFFNYFKSRKAPPKDQDEMEDMDEDDEAMKEINAFEDDTHITEEIEDEIIPNAIYYYFGIMEDSSDESSQESGDDGSDSDHKGSQGKSKKKKSTDESEPSSKKECKQQ